MCPGRGGGEPALMLVLIDGVQLPGSYHQSRRARWRGCCHGLQAYGASWRPCGVDSIFLPGTQVGGGPWGGGECRATWGGRARPGDTRCSPARPASVIPVTPAPPAQPPSPLAPLPAL